MNVADGWEVVMDAALRGAKPDPELHLDLWSEEHMVVPKSGAKPGKYRIDHTPMARRILQVLSPGHPCKRVVVKGASQLLKTQIAINAIGGWIHLAPSNILALEPTDKLAKRLSARISQAIKDVDVLRERVAAPRSRDSRNTIDAKDFDGGALYITTAGAAANLAEIPARYIIFDEVDRMLSSVDGEGDPIALGEARATTFNRNAKFYAVSSPTITGESKIDSLYEQGTQEVYEVPCPHCGHLHELVLEHFRYARDPVTNFMSRAWFVCPECGGEIEEHHKAQILPDEAMGGRARWRAGSGGDGETVSFHVSAFYAPIGSVTWVSLAREHARAEEREKRGDVEAKRVFRNTRLALSFKVVGETTTAEQLKARAEAFPLRRVPRGGLVLTAGVDTQDNRLEVMVWAFGRGEEMWTIDYRVINGDPGQPAVWHQLDTYLTTRFPHEGGQSLGIDAVGIDVQGHHTHRVYQYAMYRESRRVHAVRGDPKPGKPIVAGRASPQAVNVEGRTIPNGVKLWHVGTDTAKDLFFGRLKLPAQPGGPGRVHLSRELPTAFFEHLSSEQRIPVRTARGMEYRWVKLNAASRNEALDCTVYALFGAARMGLDQYTDAEWQRLDSVVNPPIADLFAPPAPDPLPAPIELAAEEAAQAVEAAAESAPHPDAAAVPPPEAAALMPLPAGYHQGRRVRSRGV